MTHSGRRLGRMCSVVCMLIAGACADDRSDDTQATDPIDEALALLYAPWCMPLSERVCAPATCGCTASPAWPSD